MDRTKRLGYVLYMLWIAGVMLCSAQLQAQDLRGLWQHVDDKTGTVKAIIEMRKDANGVYSGKIIKVMSRPGFNTKELCHNCPAPYSNKAIIGLDVLTGLTEEKDGQFNSGKLLDPFNGELLNTKAKASTTGNRLMLRCSLGNEAPRTQVWMRMDNKN